MNVDVEHLANQLIASIQPLEKVVIAFSGGVDSGVVAAAAYRALGSHAIAITGVGSAVSESELQIARDVTKSIGIRHLELSTQEISDVNYIRNDSKRCYYCKTNLYSRLRSWADEHGFLNILSGANLDDLGDYRPGLQAAAEFHVTSPLADLKIDKATVRKLASYFGLEIAEKPASPCLASRIAYGQSVTEERLRSIEQAEAALNNLGFEDVRVRLHADSLIRIEVQLADLMRACEPSVRNAINEEMLGLGFKFVTLDLMGRKTGSLNQVLPILRNFP